MAHPARGRRLDWPVHLMRVHLALAVAALEEAPHDDEEDRHEEDREHRRRDHPAHHAGADRAPVETTSGSTPRMNAIDVIRIGRKRKCTASSVACTRSLPCACRSFANSMIRIAFFADRPITVIRPT